MMLALTWITPFEMEDGSDFYESAGTVEFHEVKGTTRKKKIITLEDGTKFFEKKPKPYIEDDALVKIKTAAEQHPYKFILVWKGEGGEVGQEGDKLTRLKVCEDK